MDSRLKSKIIIDQLFSNEGSSFFLFPIKLVYIRKSEFKDLSGLQYGVSVSRRMFKRAVDRNKLKRRMREAIRLHSNTLSEKNTESSYTAMMFIYVGKEILEYKTIEKAVKILFKKMSALNSY